jgi:hypothetical protein
LPAAFALASSTQQASTAAGAGPPQHPGAGGAPLHATTRADARLPKFQFDALGGLAVPCDVGRDRAYLFVARDHQEGRGPSIRFDAGKVQAGVILDEFAGAMRQQILAQPTIISILAIPILIQVYFNSALAYVLNRLAGEAHCVAGPSALIGASNFFELAVAAAIICGFPYVVHHAELQLVAVPLWHHKPLYQSYLIIDRDRKGSEIIDLGILLQTCHIRLGIQPAYLRAGLDS